MLDLANIIIFVSGGIVGLILGYVFFRKKKEILSDNVSDLSDVKSLVQSLANQISVKEGKDDERYEVINKIVAKGQLATPITLKNYFEIEKSLEEIGGSNYLARLANAAVSLDYAKNYAHIIYDLAVRRSLYDLGGKLSFSAIESDMDINPSDLIEEAERDLYQISEKGTQAHNVQTFKTSIEEAVELATKAFEKDSSVVGLSSNFRDLDQN